MIDSFGVQLDSNTDRQFYDVYSFWGNAGWLIKHVTVNNRNLDEEKGFILTNGTFKRFEPIGMTWNDSYCRKITDAGPSGCFVERDLSKIPDFNYEENKCLGIDSTNLALGQVEILYIKPNSILNLNKAPYKCFGFEWKQCEDSPLEILEESNCPIIEEQVPIQSHPISIELDDSLLDRYNEFSEEELEDWFGTFVPVQSLNPYMTKVSMCSIEKFRLE